MKFCFDIDGVLATTVEDLDYMSAMPIRKNIDLVNRLYEKGHTITLYTARGSETKMYWESRTQAQMRNFGVLFHRLVMGKPAADYYVDDKFATIEQIRELADEA